MVTQSSKVKPVGYDQLGHFALVQKLLDLIGTAKKVPHEVLSGLTGQQIRTLREGLEWALVGESIGDEFLRFLSSNSRGLLDLNEQEHLPEAETSSIRNNGIDAASLTTLVEASTTPDYFVELMDAIENSSFWEARAQSLFDAIANIFGTKSDPTQGNPTEQSSPIQRQSERPITDDTSTVEDISAAIRELNGLPEAERSTTLAEGCRWVKTRLHGHKPLLAERMRQFILNYATALRQLGWDGVHSPFTVEQPLGINDETPAIGLHQTDIMGMNTEQLLAKFQTNQPEVYHFGVLYVLTGYSIRAVRELTRASDEVIRTNIAVWKTFFQTNVEGLSHERPSTLIV
jgi:hypothetical protein